MPRSREKFIHTWTKKAQRYCDFMVRKELSKSDRIDMADHIVISLLDVYDHYQENSDSFDEYMFREMEKAAGDEYRKRLCRYLIKA